MRQRTGYDQRTGMSYEVDIDPNPYSNGGDKELYFVKEIEKRYGGKPFTRMFDADYYSLVDLLSDGAFKFFTCMTRDMDRRTNYCEGSVVFFAEKYKVCKSAAERYFKELQTADAVRMKSRGVWMINPGIVVRTKDAALPSLLEDYYRCREPNKKKKGGDSGDR